MNLLIVFAVLSCCSYCGVRSTSPSSSFSFDSSSASVVFPSPFATIDAHWAHIDAAIPNHHHDEINTSAPTVSIADGVVEGYSFDGVDTFKGIPYAAPPLGSLRWAAPQPPQKWNSVLKATKYGDCCLQESIAFPMSENCLFLNVFAPKNVSKPLPVMVWIHGGSFRDGCSALYSGHNLVKNSVASGNSVIYVSINYRLSSLGFVVLNELLSESPLVNFGLQDQQYALQWVQNNIAAFGGDPSQVTIFGESAGAFSVNLHYVMKNSYGLFSKGIAESGGIMPYAEMDRMISWSENLAESVGCDPSASNFLQCFRAVNGSALVNSPVNSAPGTFYPSIGDPNLPQQPLDMMNNGSFQKIPLLTGVNEFEGNIFAFSVKPDMQMSKLFFEASRIAYFDRLWNSEVSQFVKEVYNPIGEIEGYWMAYSWVLADSTLNCGDYFVGKSFAKFNVPVYKYLFTNHDQRWFPRLNATHTSEIPFVFDMGIALGAKDKPYAIQMNGYWSRFASAGAPVDPHSTTDQWPLYDPSRDTVKVLDRNVPNSTLVSTYRANICELWLQQWKLLKGGKAQEAY